MHNLGQVNFINYKIFYKMAQSTNTGRNYRSHFDETQNSSFDGIIFNVWWNIYGRRSVIDKLSNIYKELQPTLLLVKADIQ